MLSLVRMALPPVMKLLGGCVLLRVLKFEKNVGAYAARACAIARVLISGDRRSAWMPRLFSRAIRTASSAVSRSSGPCATPAGGAGVVVGAGVCAGVGAGACGVCSEADT